jgi:hypothetical protein
MLLLLLLLLLLLFVVVVVVFVVVVVVVFVVVLIACLGLFASPATDAQALAAIAVTLAVMGTRGVPDATAPSRSRS